MAHLQQMYRSLGENTHLYIRIFRGSFALQEGVIFYPFLFADLNLENAVRRALGRPHGRLTSEEVTSLTELSGRLFGAHMDIQNLAGLDYFTALHSLGLYNNQITDVGPLANLTNLRELFLFDNQITDVGPLVGLTNLEWLKLDNNRIEDLAPLVSNAGLGEGDEVRLEGNPLSDQAINEHIPALEARGVEVIFY